jgi:D-glycero-D-manno-heptose 1,7-bisphosphate phosphatase
MQLQRLHPLGSFARRCILPDAPSLRPAVFIDRDGTISEEVGYLNHASRFRMFPFAARAIRRLNEAKLPVVVITNQSGVGRGYFPEILVRTVHELMTKQLEESGARVDAIYYCPHTGSDQCTCRKPKPGLLERAAREHKLDLARCFVVGDRYGDIELARCTGSRGILVRTGYGEGEIQWHAAEWPTAPDFIAEDLASAVDWILRQTK